MAERVVDEIEAGCTLDERVAREVLGMTLRSECPGEAVAVETGWQCRKCGRQGEGEPPATHPEHPPRSSSNLGTAWKLVERFAREGARVEVSANAPRRGPEPWCAVIESGGAEHCGTGETAALAICRAALKAAAGAERGAPA